MGGNISRTVLPMRPSIDTFVMSASRWLAFKYRSSRSIIAIARLPPQRSICYVCFQFAYGSTCLTGLPAALSNNDCVVQYWPVPWPDTPQGAFSIRPNVLEAWTEWHSSSSIEAVPVSPMGRLNSFFTLCRVSCPRNTRYFAGGILAVFQARAKRRYVGHTGRASSAEKQPTGPGPKGCDENGPAAVARRSRIGSDMLLHPPVRLGPPCRRPILIATKYSYFG